MAFNKKVINIHIDFETYSESDLTKIGAVNYAIHPTTKVLCMSYFIEGEDKVKRWRPGMPYPFAKLKGRIIILAFNSAFERMIWTYVCTDLYNWPELELEQFRCVSAQARCQALPSSLENVALMLNLKHKKDMAGHRHMLKMCRPASDREQLTFLREFDDQIPETTKDPKTELKLSRERLLDTDNVGKIAISKVIIEDAKLCHHTAANLRKLEMYCDKDVLTELAVCENIDPWTPANLEAFFECERINDFGWCVNKGFAKAAIKFADEEKEYFSQRMLELTDGAIRTPKQYKAIKDWLLPQVSEDILDIMKTYDKGELKYSLDSDTRHNLLIAIAEDPDIIAPHLAEFIDILDQAGKSTISKYESIVSKSVFGATSKDNRVHALYKYAGAAQTGRYSSFGLQVHNLARDVPPDALDIIREIGTCDNEALDEREHTKEKVKGYTTGPAIHLLAKVIRPTFRAPKGKKLIWGDWSAIEARMLPWLSGDSRANEVLDVFRSGKDIYLNQAEKILSLRPGSMGKKDPRRQSHGKVPVLSLGYGGSVGAFMAMAKAYRVTMEKSAVSKIVKEWRAANEWAVDFWYALEEAAINAIEVPGAIFHAGRVSYKYDPDKLNGIGALMCTLPSTRKLYYPGAQVDLVKKPWGEISPSITAFKSAWKPGKDSTEWPRMSAWYGLLAENITQAACADLIAHCLNECRDEEIDICAHTHDELIAETGDLQTDMKLLQEIMEDGPNYFKGLPLKADIEYGEYYKVVEGEL